MKLKHRLGFYFTGFTIGIVFLIFFLSGKKTSCHYFPNARVLNDIRTKSKKYSASALSYIMQNELDTTKMNTYLQNADIHFGESQTDLKPCPIYTITKEAEDQKFHFIIKNCVDFAEIQSIDLSTRSH